VTVAPAREPGDLWLGALPSLANFDQIFEQMDRQAQAIEQMARQPAQAPGVNVASFGDMPAGADSVSVVSLSNGASTCTRTTEVVSQGPGKPPKVTTSASGSCGAPAQPEPPPASGKPIDHT
jgi:hypothetical protein